MHCVTTRDQEAGLDYAGSRRAPRKLQATWFMKRRASRLSRPSTRMWNCS